MKNRSLHFKLLVAGTLCVLLPLLSLQIVLNIRMTANLKAANEQSTLNIAKSLANLTQAVLEGEIKLAKDLAVGNTTIDVATKVAEAGVSESAQDIARLERKLTGTMKQIGENYETIIVCDAQGTVYADSMGGANKGVSLKDRPYFQDARAGKISQPTPVKSKFTGRPVVPVCAPVLAPSGQFAGAVVIVLKMDFLSEKILAVKAGETGYPYMVDRNGIIIIHPNPKHILELDLKKIEGMKSITEKMLAQQTGVETYTFQGVEKISAFTPVPLTGWGLGVTLPIDELMATAISVRNAIILISILFIVIAQVAIWFFSRSITRPIYQIVEGLNDASEQVSSAASEVSSASQTLAEGASEQAASVEETSSSLEEMSSMIKQNATNAGEADALMKQAKAVVSQANSSMSQLTVSMQEIAKASEDTSKIIKTIDEIAFQTNLLALNAAVEAARAGEAGAGFAVVADEVRNLAMRAAEAAKNTAALIEGTVKKVAEGSELVIITNNAFHQVAGSAEKVGELVGEIAAASNEQAEGIEHVNTAVTEMDNVTQQNASTAEESASASEEMSAQSEEMKAFVSRLAVLVGGKVTGSRGRAGKAGLPGSDHHAAKPATRAFTVFNKPSKANHMAPPKTKPVNARAVVPMQADDFEDF
ncbi:MAG: methyl-accepting chemotaxis protein [Pseudomonadota bacterium]